MEKTELIATFPHNEISLDISKSIRSALSEKPTEVKEFPSLDLYLISNDISVNEIYSDFFVQQDNNSSFEKNAYQTRNEFLKTLGFKKEDVFTQIETAWGMCRFTQSKIENSIYRVVFYPKHLKSKEAVTDRLIAAPDTTSLLSYLEKNGQEILKSAKKIPFTTKIIWNFRYQ